MEWIIRRYMVEAKIKSIVELADMTGITRRHLYDMLKDPHRVKISEIKMLDKVLHFTDEDLLRLVRL